MTSTVHKSPSDFTLNVKDSFTKTSLNQISFKLDVVSMKAKVVPAIRAIDSYALGETLLKIEVFNQAVKFSTINYNLFADVLYELDSGNKTDLPAQEYMSFVLNSDKFLNFFSSVNEGTVLFNIDLTQRLLELKLNDLTLNLYLKANSEFVDYESSIKDHTVLSNKVSVDNIKKALDFCDLIFSKSEETNKTKEISISNDLIYTVSAFTGATCVSYSDFGSLDMCLRHELIKVFPSILSILSSDETKAFSTPKFLILKDATVMFGTILMDQSHAAIKESTKRKSIEDAPISKIFVNRKNLIRSLSTLSILLKDLQDDLVKFSFTHNQLKISVVDQITQKESYDLFKIDYEDADCELQVRFDSILSNLKFFGNREIVDIEISQVSESNKALRIREISNKLEFSSLLLDISESN